MRKVTAYTDESLAICQSFTLPCATIAVLCSVLWYVKNAASLYLLIMCPVVNSIIYSYAQFNAAPPITNGCMITSVV